MEPAAERESEVELERTAVRSRDADTTLTYRRLLGARLRTHCMVRVLVAMGMVSAGSFGRHVLGIEELDLRALCLLALAIALYNLVPWILTRGFRLPDVASGDEPRIVPLAYLLVVLDFLALTYAIWLLGGCRSPFVVFYLVHLIVGSLLLSRRGALALIGLAYALLIVLVAVEWSGLATPRFPLGLVSGVGPLETHFAITLLVVHGALFALISFLLLGLTRSLRQGEQRVQLANAELRRLSEQRRAFLHIAMHNLKAPLGAVTMYLDNILAGLAGPLTDKQRGWLEKCLGRLSGQTRFLLDMQQLASLEKAIINETFETVDLPGMLWELVIENRDVAARKGLELQLHIPRNVPPVVGHERLLREAVVNYITNAIQYTPSGGHVDVRLVHREPWVRIEVCDDGIGVAEADRKRLFGEFVRVIPSEASGREVQGGGLGLSIVKRVVLAHDGRVGVESNANGGATFFIELPALLE